MSQYPPPNDPSTPGMPQGASQPSQGYPPPSQPPYPGYPPQQAMPPGYGAPSQPMYPGYAPSSQQLPPGFPQPRMSGGARKAWIAPVAIIATVVLVLGVVIIPHLSSSSSVQGTWWGHGVLTTVDSTEPSNNGTAQVVIYMSLNQSNGGSISGSGEACFHDSGSNDTMSFAISGSGSNGTYSIAWNYRGGGSDHFQATVSGSSMALSATYSRGTADGGTVSGTLTGSVSHGSESDYQAACKAIFAS